MLTKRQLEVLQLYANGMDRPLVAAQLAISPATVGVHLVAIREKLKATTIAHAVAIGLRGGYIQ